MAEEKNLTLSAKDLQALINSAVTAAVTKATEAAAQGNIETFKMLADAIIESRKPYVDPNKVKNEELMREQMREQRRRLEESLKRDQARCQHLQGSHELSDFPSPHGLTSIVHHYLDTGEQIGICTNLDVSGVVTTQIIWNGCRRNPETGYP